MSTNPDEPQLQNGDAPAPESATAPEPELAPAPEPDADPKVEVTEETSIHPPSTEQTPQKELQKDGGSRTFTMRELLTELKSEGEDSTNDASARSVFCLSDSLTRFVYIKIHSDVYSNVNTKSLKYWYSSVESSSV